MLHTVQIFRSNGKKRGKIILTSVCILIKKIFSSRNVDETKYICLK